MNKFKILIGLILLLSFHCFRHENIEVIEYWENGEIKKTRLQFVENNSVLETTFYINGNKETEIVYFNGKLDGKNRYWNEYGVLISLAEYSNGKPNGVWLNYNDNGVLVHEANYFHGEKHGYERWYHNNSQLKSETLFEFGVQISEKIRWDADGKIIY